MGASVTALRHAPGPTRRRARFWVAIALGPGALVGLVLLAGMLVVIFGAAQRQGCGAPSSAQSGISAAGTDAIPARLLPLYRRAAVRFGLGRDGWAYVASINAQETDFGRNLSVSSAGALGWMQFMPSTWGRYGVDGNHDGRKDPADPRDAIPATANYLHASGAPRDWVKAIFAYNHAGWYVAQVTTRAKSYIALGDSITVTDTAPTARGGRGQPVAEPPIQHDFISFGARRRAEMAGYARRHYGISSYHLTNPQVIVEHYTETTTWQSARNLFAVDRPDSELHELPGTTSHFIVDQDGTIHQVLPLKLMGRHTVGLNYTAVGIEMVGMSDREILHRPAELHAAITLTRWLQTRYAISTENVIGHNESLTSPYHHERVARLRNQAHSDWTKSDMDRFRAQLGNPAAPGNTAGVANCAGGAGGDVQLTPGERARIDPRTGLALAPADAPPQVKAMIAGGNRIIHARYRYGAGHAPALDTVQRAYDCSSSVSFALHGGGLLGRQAQDSGQLMSWGASGDGRWVTVHANPGHVFVEVAGIYLNTGAMTGRSRPAGSGPRWGANPPPAGYDAGFAHRHPPGL